MQTDLAAMQQKLHELENHFEQECEQSRQLQKRLELAEARFDQAQRRLKIQAGLAFVVLILSMFLSPSNRAALAQSGLTLQELANRYTVLQRTVNLLQQRVTVLENKTQFMTADSSSRSTTFSGCNLYLNNGSGFTTAAVANNNGEGLGNLIIGYNATGNVTATGDVRTGSHNLILGDQNSYTGSGSLIVGISNAATSNYATVVGGSENIATGNMATVIGGSHNTASGQNATVSGGYFNVANSLVSTVVGGDYNVAGAQCAYVGGGQNNHATGFGSAVSGGATNMASGYWATVTGGNLNSAQGNYVTIGGGANLSSSTIYGWMAGSQAVGGHVSGNFSSP